MNHIIVAICLAVLAASHPIDIQASQPHSKDCYTQGLFFLNSSHLFETCGLYNSSHFRILRYTAEPFSVEETYRSVKPWKLNVFLEGGILFKGYIYLLTWMESLVYKLDPETLEVVDELRWGKQGWGLTQNGTHMFTTDGSDKLYIVDEEFRVVEERAIRNKMGRRQYNINELEWVDGYIYANIYMDTKIVKIDVASSKIVGEFDGAPLARAESGVRSDEVLNGIAFDSTNDKFILTGKHWSKIYQVTL